MKARIKTKVEHYNGESVGVKFVDGKAEADINESQLNYFKSALYSVILLEMPKLAGPEPAKEPSAEKTTKKASPKRTAKRSKKC